jgi:RNA polymerase subunit RPABC4/transcription elongation factor Spt4
MSDVREEPTDGTPAGIEADQVLPSEPPADLPPGNSAVEIAARSGFGPLSGLSSRAWHGDSRPCVSCGQLVRRESLRCDACGEDLSDDMIGKMKAFAGPWYVHEHVRPFPGVTLDRLVRQIRRGVLTRTTIVRGPTTHHQWRYAAETPGLSKHLWTCWNCQNQVSPGDNVCIECGVDLDDADGEVSTGRPAVRDEAASPQIAAAAAAETSRELAALQAALTAGNAPVRNDGVGDRPRVGSIYVGWIVAGIMVLVIGALFAVISMRGG